MKEIRQAVLDNKNDLIEKTFCHELFEYGVFNAESLDALLEAIMKYAACFHGEDAEMRDLLRWIVQGVEQCFLSHHEDIDLFFIKNYSPNLEEKWRHCWKIELEKFSRVF